MTLTLSALLVTFLATAVIPVLTGLATKLDASPAVKQLITAVLSAVSGLLTVATQMDGTAVISKEALVLAIGTFILTQATYLGLYRPHHLDARLSPNTGLGGQSPPHDPAI